MKHLCTKYYLLKWVGKRLYFRDYHRFGGSLGPRFTNKRREAMRFKTKKQAELKDVCNHPLCTVEVREYQR